jgi:hypothetical protein
MNRIIMIMIMMKMMDILILFHLNLVSSSLKLVVIVGLYIVSCIYEI